jgi:hypothetical protein
MSMMLCRTHIPIADSSAQLGVMKITKWQCPLLNYALNSQYFSMRGRKGVYIGEHNFKYHSTVL